ncbi:MAG: 50S ribosomal protein L33 [Gammaproteobacteria bacterium RIFCSPHIGHO2_02_FULL_42_13]|nr:MAG: 50S ribosomal protein L33 [Gammaproteobacteria bacterium RIFCSPHIGHO2_02_FULL_42_13]OGT68620.1 MAG: 50S ribosomal protein L33 [Gammaproteobacteria bacterium RIFCSPLOWO2_02_FULL_42_9]HLB57443.1 50S ribosomal protein L33 [Gammaproteobacteria bacterium]
MASVREKIRLNSTGKNKAGKSTGYFKTTKVNKRTRVNKKSTKLVLKCFDPRAYNKETGKCGQHVIFEEGKIK